MAKARFNKFIFPQDNFFFRLKTMANNLKVKKESGGYCMEFASQSTAGNTSLVPVVYVENFSDEIITRDAESLGLNADIVPAQTNTKKFYWGELKTLKADIANYYYLAPSEQPFAIKIGPIDKNVDGANIEMDFQNIQWGDIEELAPEA